MSHGGREQCAALLLAAREQGQLRPRRAASTELASGYAVDLAHPLSRWVERDGLNCASSVYCPLPGSTRSTIAAAFSPCGCLLASTHGDHSIKLTCASTGALLQTLRGHERTPWVVSFHPRRSDLLASGSLDHHTRLWDVASGACIKSWCFGKAIASISFHPDVPLLAVASGHKVHLWDYSQPCSVADAPQPRVALETQRTLRAVRFARGGGLLLTAHVNQEAPPGAPGRMPPAVAMPPPAEPLPHPASMETEEQGAEPPPPEREQTLRLRLWRFDADAPAPLSDAVLTLEHVALCSEMCAGLSPCGRLLAAICVTGGPVGHACHEARVYSLAPGACSGALLAARSVAAGSRVTSLQFSPTSSLLLLAYGCRDEALLRVLYAAGAAAPLQVHAMCEVLCARTLRPLRTLHTAGDELNVALFHPQPGGGVAYGTKNGRLRLIWRRPAGGGRAGRSRGVEERLEDALLSSGLGEPRDEDE